MMLTCHVVKIILITGTRIKQLNCLVHQTGLFHLLLVNPVDYATILGFGFKKTIWYITKNDVNTSCGQNYIDNWYENKPNKRQIKQCSQYRGE